jgi:oligopeptide/dipeptide ABC transporter ATP-binding protein
MNDSLMQLTDVSKTYRSIGGRLHALRGVTLSILQGESVAIVGESGCGKSTLSRLAIGLERPDAGTIEICDLPLTRSRRSRRLIRSSAIQLVPQEAGASLDPRLSIGAIVAEPLEIHRRGTAQQRAAAVQELLAEVGLDASLADRYPHQLSGGQRQRVAIARALALAPKLLIADEPVSALDVSVQAQILELLHGIRQRRNLALLVIAHDLAFVRSIADRIDVMYLGRIVESGPTDEVIAQPKHPYTAALIAAFPDPNPRNRKQRQTPIGEVPSPVNLPLGCAYASRCLKAQELCATADPKLVHLTTNAAVACHFPLV